VGLFVKFLLLVTLSICALVVGTRLQGLQSILLEVALPSEMIKYARLNQIQGFLIFIKVFLCLARPIKQLAKKWWHEPKIIPQTTPTVGKTEPHSWKPDAEATRSDGERGLGSQPTSVSSEEIPRMSPSAETIGLGVEGSINFNGGQCSPADIPAAQL